MVDKNSIDIVILQESYKDFATSTLFDTHLEVSNQADRTGSDVRIFVKEDTFQIINPCRLENSNELLACNLRHNDLPS